MPNIVFTDEVEGNPSAIVEIKNTEDGQIVGIRLVESSGNKGWDEAVLKAVVRTQKLPLDANGKAPSIIIITFKPK
jgi:colicin import membrane protein